MVEPILAGLSVTVTPAFSRAATLSDAAPTSGTSVSICSESDSVKLTLATGDDGTSVTHASTGGCSPASNEAHDGLGVGPRLVVLLKVLGSLLLHATTNLTNEDNTLGTGVLKEQFYHIDMLRAGEGVTADTDDERLAKSDTGRLRDGLVREGARARDDACSFTCVNKWDYLIGWRV